MNDEYEQEDNPWHAIVKLLVRIDRLIQERNQARAIAALLEAECAQCWGPVHASAIHQLHEGAQ